MPTNEAGNDLGPRYDLTCWYISRRRAAELLGVDFLRGAASFSVLGFTEHAFAVARLKDGLVQWMNAKKPRTLGQLALSESVKPGTFFTHYADFYCKRTRRGHAPDTVRCYSEMSEPFSINKVTVSLSTDDFTSTSSQAHITGRKPLFLLAVVESVAAGAVVAIPYALATMLPDARTDAPIGSSWSHRNQVFPELIDAFEQIKNETTRRCPSELQALKNVSENDIKHAIAEILNEPTVLKDWGGERSDLFSSYVSMSGRRIATAFAFKGPSKFGPMTFADLGARGDQIDRLFSEPADLLVLQHCHEIKTAVRGAMRAYASQIDRPRIFMLLDGYDTLRLLRAYGKCGFRPTRQG